MKKIIWEKVGKIFLAMSVILILSVVNASAERLSADFTVTADFDKNINLAVNASLDSLYIDNMEIEKIGYANGEDILVIKTFYKNGSLAETKNIGFSFYLPGSILVSQIASARGEFNYNKNLRWLRVFYKNRRILNIDINNILCNNNNVCDGNENYLSCDDCKWYDEDGICSSAEDFGVENINYWEDYFCDRDCYNDDDCNKENCNDGRKNQNETSIDEGGVCDIVKPGLNIQITPSQARVNQSQYYTVNAKITCVGDCGQVRAWLHYRQQKAGWWKRIFGSFLSLLKGELTGQVVIKDTGDFSTRNANPASCGAMKNNECNLQWRVKADKSGQYINFIQVWNNKDKKNIYSEKIDVRVMKKGVKEEQGLIAYYPFDLNAQDYSGYENDGLRVLPVGAYGSYTAGKIDKAVYLKGNYKDYVQVLDSPELRLQNFTISLWIKPDVSFASMPLKYAYLVSKYAWKNNIGYLLFGVKRDKSNILMRLMAGESTKELGQVFYTYTKALPTPAKPDTDWNHIVAVYDGSKLKLYENNKLISQKNYNKIINHDNRVLFIGRGFKGAIDELKIYNRALSEYEISRLYNVAGIIQPILR